jgi:hypothetical protein
VQRSLVALVLASLLSAACSTADITSSVTASLSISPSPGASTEESPAEPSPSPQPSPSAAALPPFETAKVVVDGLAVRQGPGTSRPFIAAYRDDYVAGTAELVTDQLRLRSGHYLRIWAGPLVLDDTMWYRVHNVQQPDEEQPLRWMGSDGSVDAGWVAGASHGDVYLVAEEMPQPSNAPPFAVGRYWAMHGVGDATSRRIDFPLDEGGSSPVGVDWFAADPEGMDCEFTVTLEPDGWELASAGVHDWGEGRGLGAQVELLGEKWLSVDSDCSWALVAFAQQG